MRKKCDFFLKKVHLPLILCQKTDIFRNFAHTTRLKCASSTPRQTYSNYLAKYLR